MKIVHSLWSKPGRKKGDLNKCGWLDKRYNYFGWALSALQLRKYYDELELVTDSAGYDLLITRMELPYTSTRVVLDELNGYHEDLYALGKIYAYGIQDKPFIHVDSDVFIWERFDRRLESASLVGQAKEDAQFHNMLYSKAFLEMAQVVDYYPEILDESIGKNNRVLSVNAGILGGNDTGFIKYFTGVAFDFVDRNVRRLRGAPVRNFNAMVEQVLFYALAEEKAVAIEYLTPNLLHFNHLFADFTGVPARTKFIHLMGSLKRERSVLDQMEYRLWVDYPEYYFRILGLIRSHKI